MVHGLTELQLAIMDVLWSAQEAPVTAVHAALLKDRRIAQSTVATLLARLEEKGVVERRSVGRQYVYRATVTRPQVRHSLAREFMQRTSRLFEGDVASLVSALLAGEDVRPDDLARARQLLAEREREIRDRGGQE